MEYNDSRRVTHSDILALYDRAIDMASKGGSAPSMASKRGIEMTNSTEILRAARERIASQEQWMKGSFKKEPSGGIYAYCAVGALNAAVSNIAQEAYGDSLSVPDELWQMREHALRALGDVIPSSFLDEMEERVYFESRSHAISCFNDWEKTTHADILALYQRALDYVSLYG